MSTSRHDASLAPLFADVARRLLADVTIRKSPADHQFLWDVMRGRYQFGADTRVEELCERSSNPVVRRALGDAILAHGRQREPRVTDADADRLTLEETDSESRVNPLQARWQVQHERHQVDGQLSRALSDALVDQEEATRRFRECVELEIPT